jgi:hypothetical protein
MKNKDICLQMHEYFFKAVSIAQQQTSGKNKIKKLSFIILVWKRDESLICTKRE